MRVHSCVCACVFVLFARVLAVLFCVCTYLLGLRFVGAHYIFPYKYIYIYIYMQMHCFTRVCICICICRYVFVNLLTYMYVGVYA